MYTALILVLIAIAAFFFISGVQKRKPVKVFAGLAIGVLTLAFFWFMGFWGEVLWFQNLGYGSRLWTVVYSNSILAVISALLGLGICFLLTNSISKEHKILRSGSRILGLFIGASWGLSNWEIILKFFEQVSTGLKDPILGKDVGFYLFTLPFLDSLYNLLFLLTVISLIAVIIALFIRFEGNNFTLYFPNPLEVNIDKFYFPLYFNAAIFIFIMAFGEYINRFDLMYSTTGVVAGPGWTDVHVSLPAYAVLIILMIIIGISLIVPTGRKRIQKFYFKKFNIVQERSHGLILISTAVLLIAINFIALTAIPGLLQWLMVQPNEITYERPYIANNIKFTRYAFGLNKIKLKEYPMDGAFNQSVVAQNPSIFSNIRLWDWRALDAVYRQFQEFRLYYEFSDVDVDRYKFGGQYRQVMVSGREININNLPPQSQTFVNERFQYTHGYGIAMSTVNEFSSQGLPHMLIKDIPPKSEYPSLEVKQPRIYYGELTTTPVIVNSKEKEFDYPSGADNVYTRYNGKGGVRISNFWRKFLFGWKFDGTNFLFSDYPTDSSRIMFHRQISKRVKLLAPFLKFDNDAYLVLANGKLYWMIDAYTTSQYFPYSQPSDSYISGINYIRNSVKAVVNAYDGTVNFYIMDNTDPIIKVWDKIFPGLFKSKDQMPKDLLAHIRYPTDLLQVQGLIFEKYHMTDPIVFYNQEDLWMRATEKYYSQVQPVDPYYIMWQLPGMDKPQFVVMMPFTPKNRQVLIGWIAGMCDPDNYGQLIAYQFPKDKTILGPQQVETKIDQDSFLSGQLTLWDQRGSNVIRGNVLAIPVNNTLFYVEPIYLKAETAAYPELQLVVVMQGNNMSYAKTFDQALNGLFAKMAGEPVQTISTTGQQQTALPVIVSMQQQIQTANDAFNNYLKLSGEKKFTEAAKELEKLQQSLQDLSNQKQNAAVKKK